MEERGQKLFGAFNCEEEMLQPLFGRRYDYVLSNYVNSLN